MLLLSSWPDSNLHPLYVVKCLLTPWGSRTSIDLPNGDAEPWLSNSNALQVQQALHKRAARLKKAGHPVARKQQELMHVVHVSTDLRKVSWG